MHEQPCQTLWDVNYAPQKDHTSVVAYIAGFFVILLPLLPFLIGASLHDLSAAISIAYFCTVTALV